MRLNPFSRSSASRRRSGFSSDGWLRPQTRNTIIGIVLIVYAVLLTMSFFGLAGPTGAAMLRISAIGFGHLVYVLPVGCAWLAYRLLRPGDEEPVRLKRVGAVLALIGLFGIFHVAGVSAEDAYQVALEGKGGGLVGFSFAFPLSRAFSPIAAGVIFIAALCVGVLLRLNMAPHEVWQWLSGFIPSAAQGDQEEEDEDSDEEEPEEGEHPIPSFRISRMRSQAGKSDPDQLALEQQNREEEQKSRVRAQVKSANKRYIAPDMGILHSSVGRPDSGDVNANKKKIQSTLEKFGINVTMSKVNVGPTVAQYTLTPEEGVKLSRITGLQNDLALALAAHPIRIEAPIPKTSLVGIEIPNKDVSLVRLRDLLASREFKRSQSPLTIALGKDVSGKPHIASIETMPHLLIAGATGSGKSIFINTLILSLLYRNSPSLVRMILVDPKRVELSLYNGVPHLLTPVITEPDKTINALKWAVREMDRRYRILSESGARNLMSFNANNPDEAMPMVVIVIDELADLMATHARDVEGIIVRLSQMARAVGIHLVLATQRPSVNVITGLIKANIPSRVAFNVASQVDSRTILDMSGAEKLLGSGDMLYISSEHGKPVRLQGGFVSDEEVRQVVADIVGNNSDMDMSFEEEITAPQRSGADATAGEGHQEDDLFERAKQVVIDSNKASASLLQRRLRVGYARAARLIDMLEEAGVISEPEGNKPRDVLVVSEDEYDGEPEDAVHEDEDEEPEHLYTSGNEW